MFYKALLLLVASLAAVQYTDAATDKVICFFASWAGYRNGKGAFNPEDINANLCTHVYYAFLGVDTDGNLKILDEWNEINKEGLQKVANLKSINPDLKILISIGGWNAGHDLLATVITSADLRANFVQSCLTFFQKWGYDGIDIDWEYPLESDKEDFVQLLKEMKAAFEPEGYILSLTGSAIVSSYGYDVPGISETVDLINVMTYDYHTAYDGTTGHNAPLYGGTMSVNNSISTWLSLGADASKLSLSVPFYGHSFTVKDSSDHGIGVPASAGVSGPYTQSPGTLGYHEICELHSDWTRVWDDDAQAAYIYSESNWASYDDAETLEIKAQYAKSLGLAGIAIWSIDTDDFHGNCGTKNILLQTIKSNLD